MVIPEFLRRTVAFVCYKDQKEIMRYAGTCFFFGLIPDGMDLNGKEGFFRYTITAKHVIIGIKQKSIDHKVWLRVNLKDGGSAYLDTNADDWFSNPDDPTDVSILSWSPLPHDGYEVSHIMSDMIQRDNVEQMEKVRIGDDVFIVGLFQNHTGKKRNTPIVRVGNVAMLADENEKVSTRDFADIEAHLIESRSIGGLSGSPVYVHITAPRIDDKGHALLDIRIRYMYLFGLIHGHYDAQIPEEDNIVEDDIKKEAINMGIAIVVPAKKIKEVLFHPDMVKERENELKNIKKENLPIIDTVVNDNN